MNNRRLPSDMQPALVIPTKDQIEAQRQMSQTVLKLEHLRIAANVLAELASHDYQAALAASGGDDQKLRDYNFETGRAATISQMYADRLMERFGFSKTAE